MTDTFTFTVCLLDQIVHFMRVWVSLSLTAESKHLEQCLAYSKLSINTLNIRIESTMDINEWLSRIILNSFN